MNEAIRILIEEHRFLSALLRSLEGLVGRNAVLDRPLVAETVAVLKHFSEEVHHAKEERALFPLLQRHCFQYELGPIAILLAEHMDGRRHLEELAQLAAGTGAVSTTQSAALRGHAFAFGVQLRAHMEKEERQLFTLAESSIPFEVLEGLVKEFQRLEVDTRSHEFQTRARRLLERRPA